MYNQIRDTTFWSSIRATPFIYFTFSLFNFIINPNFDNVFFLTAYAGNFILNGILKFITRSIYNLFNTDYIFPFGQGSRPYGATNCGTFAFVSNPKALSFGMPSGHSQLAWFFSTYWLLNIIEKYNSNLNNNHNKKLKILSYVQITTLLILALLVSFSRVEIEGCHTTGQVITGAIIGIASGYLTHKIKIYIKNKYFS